ncbi:MAG: hypothetical protein AB9891_11125 [Anaerolineaceae bacterium]
MEEPTYPEDLQDSDREYVIKKLGMNENEFDDIMALPVKSYRDYSDLYELAKKTIGMETARKIVQMVERFEGYLWVSPEKVHSGKRPAVKGRTKLMRIAYLSLHWPRTIESGVGKKIVQQLTKPGGMKATRFSSSCICRQEQPKRNWFRLFHLLSECVLGFVWNLQNGD